MGANLKCHLFINRSILREPIVVVEGLEIKPYLLIDAGYAS